MLKDLRDLSVDRERAIRAIALIGLLILGLVTLPGLLKTPSPPPVPPDVGFTPQELARFSAQPLPDEPTTRPRRRSSKKHEADRTPPRRAQRPKKSKGKAGSEPEPTPEKPAVVDAPAPSSQPPPAYSPPASPVVVSPPQYSAPSPAPPPMPTDGSQEFAPR